MRSFALVLLAFSAFAGQALPDDKIPQDRDLAERRSKERLEWNRRTLVGAYDRIGKKDPRWDALARETFELAARMFSQQTDPSILHRDIQKPAAEAVAAGCDDPMLLYLYRRTIDHTGITPETYADEPRKMMEVAEALNASKYPVIRRSTAYYIAAGALEWLATQRRDAPKFAEVRDLYDRSLAVFAESTGEDERGWVAEDRWFEDLTNIIAGLRKTGMDAVDAYEHVDAELAKKPDLEALRLKVRGNFWYYYGWEFRGEDFAAFVPPGGFEKMAECAAKAREALERSYELRPDSRVAALLLSIDKTAEGDRETMETWFDRAMKANPDNRAACWSKLDWLDPKWHGNWEEALAFGRACRDTGNWKAGITLLAADAHHRYCSRMSPTEMIDYMGEPTVWADIEPAYEEYLGHFPHDAEARSKYAYFCFRAGRYAEAHAQFQKLGDDLTSWSEMPYMSLDGMKTIRDQTARVVAGMLSLPTPKRTAPPVKDPTDVVLP